MSINKFLVSSAFALSTMGFVACDDSSSSTTSAASSVAEIQTLDEDAQVIVYSYANEWCEYVDGDLTWKSATRTSAYKYEVADDTLILFSYDLKEKKAEREGRVFVGGGNTLQGTWTQVNCYYDSKYDEMDCEDGDDSYVFTLRISSSDMTSLYSINSDFNYTSSYMVRDIVYAIIYGDEIDAEDWTEYKHYKADYFSDEKDGYGLSFEILEKNSMNITIDGLTYKVRNASATISNEKEQISVSVSAGGETCSLKYVYNHVTEETCNYKNILNLNIYDDEAFGYLEENEEEFSDCLHSLFKKNSLDSYDFKKATAKSVVKDHPVNKIPVYSIPVAK